MGVLGLWKLLEDASKPISSMEALRGQVVAVDVSMWAHKLMKGGVGSHEKALLATFSRISKLLYYGIRPVFIFDGVPPLVKIETQRRRRQRREAASERVERIRKQLLGKIVEMKAAADVEDMTESQIEDALQRLRETRQNESENDIFKLESDVSIEIGSTSDSALEEESDSESGENYQMDDVNFNDDNDEGLINSSYFNELPPEVRLEMLVEVKNRRKYAATIAVSSGRGDASSVLPQNSTDFSQFQLQRALTGSRIAEKLRHARREIAANAIDRAGADSNLLRRVFSGALDSETTEVRVETGVASGSSEFVFIQNRKSREDLRDFATSPSSQPVAKTTVKSELKPASASNSQSSIRSEDLFASVGSFDGSSYAFGARKIEKQQEINQPIVTSKLTAPVVSVHSDSESEGEDDFEEVPMVDLEELEEPVSCPKVQNSPNLQATVTTTEISLKDNLLEIQKTVVKEKVDVLKPDDVTPPVSPIKSKPGGNKVVQGQVKAAVNDDIEDITDLAAVESPLEVANRNDSSVEPIVDNSNNEMDKIGTAETDKEEIELGFGDFKDDSRKEPEEIRKSPSPMKGNADLESNLQDIDQYRSEIRNQTEFALLEFEREKRMATAPEQSFYSDIMELCNAFGIPFIEAPGEAEAQAAILDQANVIDCCLTDDSDYWLFGGQRVIRGMFGGGVGKKKALSDECYQYEMADIEKFTGITRELMICIALISGW